MQSIDAVSKIHLSHFPLHLLNLFFAIHRRTPSIEYGIRHGDSRAAFHLPV